VPATAAGLQEDEADGPLAVVLGTAQDAGVPQVNCFEGVCRRVRAGELAPPRVASLGLVDPAAGRRFLVDATPDLVAQVGDLLGIGPGGPEPGTVVPLHEHLDGILLTHGHMGHYTGLVHLGREAAAARGLPVWCNADLAELLTANEPFRSLVRGGHVELRTVEPGRTVRLSPSLEVEPLAVVHRAELSSTTGYLVQGPSRSLLYAPDADTWDGWPVPFETWLDRSDVALLDGTFWSGVELGHRPQAEVPHPPIVATMERLSERAGNPPDAGDPAAPEVLFIHLNHTNPVWDADGPERRELESAGFGVARTGQRLPL